MGDQRLPRAAPPRAGVLVPLLEPRAALDQGALARGVLSPHPRRDSDLLPGVVEAPKHHTASRHRVQPRAPR
eukprot:scaffold87562_cov88-Phaeocystis_antarctica.AAC.1